MALVAIRHHDQGCKVSELAEAAQQVSATMTGIIHRLAERRLVIRQRDPGDRRAFRVSLTVAGEALLAEVERQQQAQLLGALKDLPQLQRTTPGEDPYKE